jgi:hypothetical protein
MVANNLGNKQPLTNNLVGNAGKANSIAGNGRQRMEMEYEGNRY